MSTIRIPDPCNEDWNAMQPDAKGRHCASCAFTVEDLSGATDAALQERIAAGTLPKCARFKASQLGRVLGAALVVAAPATAKPVDGSTFEVLIVLDRSDERYFFGDIMLVEEHSLEWIRQAGPQHAPELPFPFGASLPSSKPILETSSVPPTKPAVPVEGPSASPALAPPIARFRRRRP